MSMNRKDYNQASINEGCPPKAPRSLISDEDVCQIIWHTLIETSDAVITGTDHTHHVMTTSTGSRRVLIGNYMFQQKDTKVLVFTKGILYAVIDQDGYHPTYKQSQKREAVDPAYLQDDFDFCPDNAGDDRVLY